MEQPAAGRSMLKVEIVGNSDAIAVVKRGAPGLGEVGFRQYDVKAATGVAGIVGLVAMIPASVFVALVGVLRDALSKDRNLEVEVNGLRFKVRDLEEARAVLDEIERRGLLQKGEKGG